MFTIINAHIVDGGGRPGFLGSVVVDGDQMIEVGPQVRPRGRVIDANGKTLVPGFIDMHSHSDVPLWIDGQAVSKVSQGITTEVVGNCGMSGAPLYGAMEEELGGLFRRFGQALPFRMMDDYVTGLEGRVAVNVVPLIGHGTLRRGIVGDEARNPTAQELQTMADAVGQAMAEGAFGLSTGLIYPPGCYANTDELVTLCRAMAPYGGIYFTHMRSENDQLLAAVEEALTVGHLAQVSVQISHHKAMGKENWGKTEMTLRRIDEAIHEGQDVWLDQYPYTASATALSSLLPKWAMAGGIPKALERLKDPVLGRKIMDETDAFERRFGWERTWIGTVKNEAYQNIQGQSIEAIAHAWQVAPVEALIRILVDNQGSVSMIRFGMHEDDLERVIRYRRTLIGTDGSAMAPHGPYAATRPHPRTYGTFPRVLRWFVREKQWLTFEEAISRMTGLASKRLGLAGRGLIRSGCFADLVLLNPDLVTDRATFDSPHQISEGIDTVWVNGQVVWHAKRASGALPGRGLRRTG